MLRFACISVLVWLASAYDKYEQPCWGQGGQCLPITSCRSSATRSGLCPSQAANIKCCMPYEESACTSSGGRCQRSDQSCSGSFVSGKCPTQPANVRCCVERGGSSSCDSSNKYADTLTKILGHEGSCQNSASDSGNSYEGKIGYTCSGITPGVGYANRAIPELQYCTDFRGHAADFVKFCWDKNSESFKEAARAIYKKNYFYPCEHLDQPAFYVCADISVNSGPGRSKKFMKELGPATDMKDYARKLNEKHRQFYKYIGRPGTSNNRFLAGWLKRADDRDAYIDSC